MILFTLLAASISLAFTLILAPSPLFLGLWILLLALSISLLLSFSAASWLGLFIFLIYVGGLLVIFAYFVALTPNLIIGGGPLYTLLPLSFITLLITINILFIFPPSTPLIFNPINIFILTTKINSAALITLALALFIALVAVVKICSHSASPLRPFN